MNWKPSKVFWSLPKVGKVCKVAGLFYISLVDIVFKKISSKKKNNVCFPIPSPPFFQCQGMYPSNTTYRNVRPKSGSSDWNPQKGRDSLSLSLSLSRSGWFHDEVAKKADKTPKRKPLARSLPLLDMDVNLLLSQLLD